MYELERLPYEYDSLEPFIDTHTLGLHKEKHQASYLYKLNMLLLENNYDYKESLEQLAKNIKTYHFSNKEDILYNLGGVINHNIYFNSMNSKDKRQNPNTLLMKLINQKFGSYDNLKKELKKKALEIKGSGYTFLVLADNNLTIVNLLNQDNPYNYHYLPLIGIDMWEHAYYLNYENKKELYVDNFLEVMDFSYANQMF